MAHALVGLDDVGRFTDQELITRLRHLVRDDQLLRARLVVHLGEVDARGLYREQAYSSMFAYCVEELRMSEAQAYLRIQAARLGRQFPRIVQLLAQGALHLSALRLLGPHLTADNHVDLLERACGKRKREVELLVAEIAPKPDVPNRTRKLPAPRSSRDTRLQSKRGRYLLWRDKRWTHCPMVVNRCEGSLPWRAPRSRHLATRAMCRCAMWRSTVPAMRTEHCSRWKRLGSAAR